MTLVRICKHLVLIDQLVRAKLIRTEPTAHIFRIMITFYSIV